MERKTTSSSYFQRQTKNIAQEMIWTWIRRRNLKRENESLLLAAQNNSIRTNNFKAKIDSTQENGKCRLCGDSGYEAVNHKISKCCKLFGKRNKRTCMTE